MAILHPNPRMVRPWLAAGGGVLLWLVVAVVGQSAEEEGGWPIPKMHHLSVVPLRLLGAAWPLLTADLACLRLACNFARGERALHHRGRRTHHTSAPSGLRSGRTDIVSEVDQGNFLVIINVSELGNSSSES